jgi:Rrf2 family protein
MDISARTMYGLRALVTLAEARTDNPMSIQEIADDEELPAKFLEGIMADLKRGGFVESRRGASGGYLLARPASEITLLEIIRHLDGPVAPAATRSRPTARRPFGQSGTRFARRRSGPSRTTPSRRSQTPYQRNAATTSRRSIRSESRPRARQPADGAGH